MGKHYAMRVIQGHTRSLDCGSFRDMSDDSGVERVI